LVRRIWIAGVIVVIALSPILFSDLFVMIPLTMAFLFAGGPVLALAQQQPTCRVCGLARPVPGWHETPCRPVRAVEEPNTKPWLKVRPSEPAERDEPSGVRTLPHVEPPRDEGPKQSGE
jgi:hypothetical protein